MARWSSAWCIALAAASLVACTSSTSTDPMPAPGPTASDDGAPLPPVSTGASAGNAGAAAKDAPAPRYFAVLSRGSCANVEGRGGTWHTSPLFPDAPPSIRDTACAFAWKAHATGATADVAALEDLRPELLTKSVQPTETSAAPRLSPGSITAFPPTTLGVGPLPTGVTGCDVCGRVLGREAYAILPAEMPNLRRMMVSTDSGKLATFEVKPGTPLLQVFSVDLPAAPENANYTQGRFFLYEAAPSQ